MMIMRMSRVTNDKLLVLIYQAIKWIIYIEKKTKLTYCSFFFRMHSSIEGITKTKKKN